jgi:uncharacterized membrane protein
MQAMSKSRLEAFSDGVIAIILTIMVLELKVPREPTVEALAHLWPIYAAYALSFGNVFMMWVAHHDIVASVRTIDYRLIFANGALLFFMSLVPFATAFAGETHWTATIPVALYGVVMFAASMGFVLFRLAVGRHSRDAAILARQRAEAATSAVVGALFLIGTAVAFAEPRVSLFLYAAVPLSRVVFQYFQRPSVAVG